MTKVYDDGADIVAVSDPGIEIRDGEFLVLVDPSDCGKPAILRCLAGIEPLLKTGPMELSGGQQQRVALGRAIVRDPAVFLMDESLSNLDAKLRTQMWTPEPPVGTGDDDNLRHPRPDGGDDDGGPNRHPRRRRTAADRVTAGETVTMRFPDDRRHLFETETGETVRMQAVPEERSVQGGGIAG